MKGHGSKPKSKRFAEERKEVVAKGAWSDFEAIVLYEVISTCLAGNNDDNWKPYNDIVDYSQVSYCVAPLPSYVTFNTKSKIEISSKIEYDKSTSTSHDNGTF